MAIPPKHHEAPFGHAGHPFGVEQPASQLRNQRMPNVNSVGACPRERDS